MDNIPEGGSRVHNLDLTPLMAELLLDAIGNGSVADGLTDEMDEGDSRDYDYWFDIEQKINDAITAHPDRLELFGEDEVRVVRVAFEDATYFADFDLWESTRRATAVRVASELQRRMEAAFGCAVNLPLELRST